jgi:uncharacterized membrane protein
MPASWQSASGGAATDLPFADATIGEIGQRPAPQRPLTDAQCSCFRSRKYVSVGERNRVHNKEHRTMSGQPLAPTTEAEKMRTIVLVVNALYAASFLVGFTSLIAVVLAYMKRPEAVGTIWEGHLTYAIRTFWMALIMGIVGVLLLVVLIGVPVLIFVGVWFVVRIVRAFLAWNDNKAIDDPKRFF